MSGGVLSAEQTACLRLDRSQAISAGAGSGKTSVLVERYCRALRALDYDVDRVLLVTFTEKAAAELRVRARKSLVASADAAAAAGDRRAAQAARAAAARLGEAWIGTIHSVCRRLETATGRRNGAPAPSRVLDGDAARELLRKTVEATLDRTAEAPEETRERAALRRLLARLDRARLRDALAATAADRAACARFLALFAAPEASTDEALGAAYVRAFAAERAIAERLRRRAFAARAADGPEGVAATRLSLALRAFETAGAVVRANAKSVRAWRDTAANAAAACAARDGAALGSAFAAIDGKKPPKPPKAFDETQASRWTALCDALQEFFGFLKRCPEPPSPEDFGAADERLDRAAPAAERDVATLLAAVDADYRAELAARDATDFDGLVAALDRRSEDPVASAALARRFVHVLIDEFQDTDERQWGIFRRWFGGDAVGRSGLCLVGDAKQAIYGFRGGDVAVFRAASAAAAAARDENGAERGEALVLRDNYRAVSGLTAFVNALQTRIFPGEDAEAFEAPRQEMTARRAPESSPAGSITVIELSGESTAPVASEDAASEDDAETLDATDAEAACAVARLKALHDDGATVFDPEAKRATPFAWRHAAILLRTRAVLPALERAAEAAGVPLRVSGGVGFYRRPEIAAAVRLAQFLADPRDDAALLDVLRAPWFALPDSVLVAARAHGRGRGERGTLLADLRALAAHAARDPQALPTPADAPALVDAVAALDRWLRFAPALSAHESLATAAEERDFVAVLDAADPSGRSAANFARLLDLLRAAAENDDAGPEDSVRMVATALEEERESEQADPPREDEDAVSVLTEHAAKGLEWPVVVLVGAGSSVLRKPSDPPFRFVRLAPDDAVRVAFSNDFLASGAVAKDARGRFGEAVAARLRRESWAEQMRLFYVAVTRARDHLVVVGRAPLAGVRPVSRLGLLEEVLSDAERVFGEGPGAAVARAIRGAAPPAFAPPPPSPPFADFPNAPPPAPPSSPAAPAIVLPADDAGKFLECPRRVFLERVVGASDDDGDEASSLDVAAPFAGERAAAATEPIGSDRAASPVPPRSAAAPGAPTLEGRVDPRVRGTVLHAAFEAFALRRDVEARARDAAFENGVGETRAVDELAREALAATERFRATDLGGRIVAAPRGTVFPECALSFGSGAIRFQGRADLVVAGEGPALVVDFKTSGRGQSDPTALRRLADQAGYRAQIELYAAALGAATGSEVDAWLYFTDCDVAVPVVGERHGRSSAAEVANLWKTRLGGGDDAASSFPLTGDRTVCRRCPHLVTGLCPGA